MKYLEIRDAQRRINPYTSVLCLNDPHGAPHVQHVTSSSEVFSQTILSPSAHSNYEICGGDYYPDISVALRALLRSKPELGSDCHGARPRTIAPAEIFPKQPESVPKVPAPPVQWKSSCESSGSKTPIAPETVPVNNIRRGVPSCKMPPSGVVPSETAGLRSGHLDGASPRIADPPSASPRCSSRPVTSLRMAMVAYEPQ